ncbi:MAG: alpha/beta fold hydrolase [Burkholderiaceae bacterium]
MDGRFETARLPGDGVTIHLRHGGKGPPLLLLHGYPQTHIIWRKVAPALAERFTLVMPDLRGYGDSDKPDGGDRHENYSKRVMARDMVAVMRALGHERFAVCGHDRGGRVAHRLALDHPQAVTKLMTLDISPTLSMYDQTDQAFATAYYHWFFLIQPAPLPETLIGADPVFYLHKKLGGWGSGSSGFMEQAAMAEYERCFNDLQAIHATCEDYRAAASIDLEHDRADAEARIACPVRVLWGERGVVGRLFDPIRDWQPKCALPVTGRATPGGHYIAEETPDLLLEEMFAFFGEPA